MELFAPSSYKGKKDSPLTLKRQTKIAADDILIVYFYLSVKRRLDVSSESSAWQRIHLKH